MSEFKEQSSDTSRPSDPSSSELEQATDSFEETAAENNTEQTSEPDRLSLAGVTTDPLISRPRKASIALCAGLGIAMLLLSAALWLFAVRTVTGQEYDDMVWGYFSAAMPAWFTAVLKIFVHTYIDVAIVAVCVVIAVAVNIVRRRWVLLIQLAVFAVVSFAIASTLKHVLPRPFLVNVTSLTSNSAPSGHTLLAGTGAVILVCAVPRVWRAVAAIVGCAFTVLVALSVVEAQWHRPADPLMSLLIIAGLACIMLACTRGSGMDEPGTRMSSASVQIVATVMITAGIVAVLYGAYAFWQIEPGLDLGAQWARPGACAAAFALMLGVSLVTFGMVAALRQLTASPLSKIGLIGAPPEPPKSAEERDN
ncbi:phosphatase PAP2 family protein [Bifidobacterium aquikefiricola]|uniref:Phosphatase PAP2 family protein n=1 Tax=Bifidobacterium aquikefiricola TaxID=3059038 RepID=A0AB39U7I6_9BIFI